MFGHSRTNSPFRTSRGARIGLRRALVATALGVGAALAALFLLALADGFFVGSEFPQARLAEVQPIRGAPAILRSEHTQQVGDAANRARAPDLRLALLGAGLSAAVGSAAFWILVRRRKRRDASRPGLRAAPEGAGPRWARIRHRVVAASAWAVLGLAAASVAAGLWAWHAASAGHPGRAEARELPVLGPATGSVIDATNSSVRSAHPYRKTVALTFEGGPDPRWTPAVLRVLREHAVPATFFLVGRNVVEHPELARREVREGHEAGLLSFNHVDLGSLSTEQMAQELRLTQAAITGATRQRSALLRPPYVGSAVLAGKRAVRTFRRASDLGYLTVLTDEDSADWRRDGVAAIVRRAMPDNGRGGIITFRDGGEDRRHTVAALSAVISQLRSKGYRFVMVSELARVPSAVGPAPPLIHMRDPRVPPLPSRGEPADADPRRGDRPCHSIGGRTHPRALVVRVAPVSTGATASPTAPAPRPGAPDSGDGDRSRAQRGVVDREDGLRAARIDAPAVRGHRRRRWF